MAEDFTTYDAGEPAKKVKKTKTKKGDSMAKIGAFAIVAAFVVFIVLTVIQNYFKSEVPSSFVVVAITNVPDGVMLTQENIPIYFAMEERANDTIPADCYKSGAELVGKITGRNIAAREIITGNCVITEDFFADIEEPIVISLDIDKIGRAVAGTIRTGDVVDIRAVIDMSSLLNSVYADDFDTIGSDLSLEGVNPIIGEGTEEQTPITVSPTESEGGKPHVPITSSPFQMDFDAADATWSPSGEKVSVCIASNVKVVSVYTSAGIDTGKAEMDGSEQVATILNVVVPRSMFDIIALAQEDGVVYVAKVVEKEEAEESTTEDEVTPESEAASSEAQAN